MADERETLEAMQHELQQLRELLKDPRVADAFSLKVLAKLGPKSSARERSMGANVAQVLLDLGQPLRAGSLFQLLMELDPTEPYYRLGRGQSHLRADEPRAALMRFDEALSIDPRLAEAYLGRAEARLKLDDTRGAFEDFEKVVELEPDSLAARLARVMMMGNAPGDPS